MGSSVADGLSRLGHDVAVIDSDSKAFSRLSPDFAGDQGAALARQQADFIQRRRGAIEKERRRLPVVIRK